MCYIYAFIILFSTVLPNITQDTFIIHSATASSFDEIRCIEMITSIEIELAVLATSTLLVV